VVSGDLLWTICTSGMWGIKCMYATWELGLFVTSDRCTTLSPGENPVVLPGEIHHSLTVISLSTALRHSRQMFQPSGKGCIRILTTRVQANCNLFLWQRCRSILIYVMITTRPLFECRHYLRSSALGHRGTQEWSLWSLWQRVELEAMCNHY